MIEQFAHITRSWRSLLAACSVVLALGIYMIYQTQNYSDPLAFWHAQADWGYDTSGWGIFRLATNTVTALGFVPPHQADMRLWLDVLSTVVFTLLALFTCVKLRPAYGVYSVLALVMPLAGGTMLSMTRHVLLLVPCYMLLGNWGSKARVHQVVLGISLPLMAYLTMLYSRWYWAG